MNSELKCELPVFSNAGEGGNAELILVPAL